MIALPAGVKVWLAAGATDMRKGFDGLAALVQTQLAEDPFSGQLFVFRGKAGDRVKINKLGVNYCRTSLLYFCTDAGTDSRTKNPHASHCWLRATWSGFEIYDG